MTAMGRKAVNAMPKEMLAPLPLARENRSKCGVT